MNRRRMYGASDRLGISKFKPAVRERVRDQVLDAISDGSTKRGCEFFASRPTDQGHPCGRLQKAHLGHATDVELTEVSPAREQVLIGVALSRFVGIAA